MKLRSLVLVLGAVLAGVIGGWYWFESAKNTATVVEPISAPEVRPGARPSSPPASGTSSRQATAPVSAISSVAPGLPMTRGNPIATPAVAVATPVPFRQPTASGLPEREGRADLENVQNMFRNFRTRMKENPVGTNAEIMKAVMGGNPASAQLGPPEGQSLNEQGELLDRWGTPYFFHQLTKDTMEVRSAGQDRVLWNADDLVLK